MFNGFGQNYEYLGLKRPLTTLLKLSSIEMPQITMAKTTIKEIKNTSFLVLL